MSAPEAERSALYAERDELMRALHDKLMQREQTVQQRRTKDRLLRRKVCPRAAPGVNGRPVAWQRTAPSLGTPQYARATPAQAALVQRASMLRERVELERVELEAEQRRHDERRERLASAVKVLRCAPPRRAPRLEPPRFVSRGQAPWRRVAR